MWQSIWRRFRYVKKSTKRFYSKGEDKAKRDTRKKEPLNQSREGQEKKSWELEPEEKTRIQKETAKIAQKHREQQEQEQGQGQGQNQELQQGQTHEQQGDFQPINQGQVPVQPQQPMIDMGGMEL